MNGALNCSIQTCCASRGSAHRQHRSSRKQKNDASHFSSPPFGCSVARLHFLLLGEEEARGFAFPASRRACLFRSVPEDERSYGLPLYQEPKHFLLLERVPRDDARGRLPLFTGLPLRRILGNSPPRRVTSPTHTARMHTDVHDPRDHLPDIPTHTAATATLSESGPIDPTLDIPTHTAATATE